ncbi:MAG: DUF3078 domain-containing protein [Paludibacteraceae bacterium]|nr:DUF3078 domain-containing protein [Paludibacteraceae bacterium]
MSKKILSVALCLMAALTIVAQDVDKATVTGNADAAAKAGADLQKLENADKAWKFDGTVGLNAAATGLVNWAAGGKNNVNGIVYAKLHLLYHKDAIAWETNLDTDFGLTWIDQDEDAFQKSSDNIKLATKFGWEFKENWYLTILGSFQSQYALGRNYVDGYNNIISKWLAPSYTDISVGIDWKKSYNGADFSIYLSPIAGRITSAYIGENWNQKYTRENALGALQYDIDHATDDATKAIAQAAYDVAAAAYDNMGGYEAEQAAGTDIRSQLQKAYGTYSYDASGNKTYRNARAEFGLSFKGGIAYTYKDLKLSTTLALFSPYQGKGFSLKEIYEGNHGAGSWETRDKNENYFEYSNNNRFFGMFDVDWDCALSYQFLKCLQVTLQTSLKYYNGTLIADKEGNLSERCQFKGVIGLGVGYSF